MKVEPLVERELSTGAFARRVNRTTSRIRQLLKNGALVGYKPEGSRDWWIPESQIAVFYQLPDGRGRPRKNSSAR